MLPSEILIAESLSSSLNPIAARVFEEPIFPDEQAAPELIAISFKSKSIICVSAVFPSLILNVYLGKYEIRGFKF